MKIMDVYEYDRLGIGDHCVILGMSNNIADIRKDYKLRSLSEHDVDVDPFKQFARWWNEALESTVDEVNAMTLATASADGMPNGRIVLLKGYDDRGFTFFTNYDSVKGEELLENPRACLVFFWKELERQVRISGLVTQVTAAESDDYFNSRPEGSRIGAWSSPQSHVIEGREWLEENEKRMREQFGDGVISRPPHWGGYRVKPIRIEFWQGRSNRMHDRLQYTLKERGGWAIERLAP